LFRVWRLVAWGREIARTAQEMQKCIILHERIRVFIVVCGLLWVGDAGFRPTQSAQTPAVIAAGDRLKYSLK
jgi:hypothetical protein